MAPHTDGPIALRRRYPRYQSPSPAWYKLYLPCLTNRTGAPRPTWLLNGVERSIRNPVAPPLTASACAYPLDSGHAAASERELKPAIRCRSHWLPASTESRKNSARSPVSGWVRKADSVFPRGVTARGSPIFKPAIWQITEVPMFANNSTAESASIIAVSAVEISPIFRARVFTSSGTPFAAGHHSVSPPFETRFGCAGKLA